MQAMNRILAAVRLRHWSIKYRIAFAVALLFVVMVALTNALQIRLLREDMGRVLSEQQFTLVQRTAARDRLEVRDRHLRAGGHRGLHQRCATCAQPARLREQFRQKPRAACRSSTTCSC